MTRLNYLIFACIGGGVLLAHSLQAQLTFTIENPGVQATTVSGATTETFDTAPLGAFSGPTAVGTLSPGGVVIPADLFGGAFNSDYYAIGEESGVYTSTLTLNGPQDYFGMWWSAGDAGNVLNFYDGATLIGSYVIADIVPYLSPAYYGNPNNGLDPGEPFVYLDFTTSGTTQITSVEFDNVSTSGFEMDNFSVLNTPITPPGNSIPDVSSAGVLLLAALAAMFGIRRSLFCPRENLC